jgi:hypothetical protein
MGRWQWLGGSSSELDKTCSKSAPHIVSVKLVKTWSKFATTEFREAKHRQS